MDNCWFRDHESILVREKIAAKGDFEPILDGSHPTDSI
jgi:hypothetical protein